MQRSIVKKDCFVGRIINFKHTLNITHNQQLGYVLKLIYPETASNPTYTLIGTYRQSNSYNAEIDIYHSTPTKNLLVELLLNLSLILVLIF